MNIKYLLIILLIASQSIFASEKQIDSKEVQKNLRCLVCQGQSVYDSDTEFANSLKILVERKLDEGLNEKQIYNFFKEKYGEWILYDPQFNKSTYFLWLLPIFMFLLGGALVFKIFILRKN